MPPQATAEQIAVTVRFFADLRRFLPKGEDGPQTYRVPAGATVADLLATIGLRQGEQVTVGLNGELAQRETPLQDGDDLLLVNPMEGG